MAHRPVQLPLGVRLRDSASFDSFYPGPNRELVAHLSRLATGRVAGSACFIAASAGGGKSHLLQATARAAGESGSAAAYLPLAELGVTDLGMLEGMGGLSLICLDDVHSIVGRRAWQEALMALYETLRAAGGVIVAAAMRPPMELGLELNDLATRLAWGPVYALKPLSDEDKVRLLQQRARGRGLELPDEVGRFLLARSAREIPALLETLDRLDHASLAAQRRLTLPFVRDVLVPD